MKTLNGKYNSAKVFTDNIEETAQNQIIELLNQDFSSNAKIRIMPDTHAGAGCVIGFTADLGEKVIPNLVGVDIGCGMFVMEIGNVNIDLNHLDRIIHDLIPSGHNIHQKSKSNFERMNDLYCLPYLRNTLKFERAIGTLGGGNHFIELNEDDYGSKYLVIHSGSRNLGKQVAEYYQDLAIRNTAGKITWNEIEQKTIEELKTSGNQNLINDTLRELKEEFLENKSEYPKELSFIAGGDREDYLHDMKICQEYAVQSRFTMANIISENLFNGASPYDFSFFSSIHNYIDFGDNIIRKGAVSAYEGEKLIIPINMRDGSILAVGKGNSDWNNSAPHGAGRIMGRKEAKRTLSMDVFKKEMKDIYSTTVNESTLDEAPMAYKPMNEIIGNIQDTVTIDKIIKPLYNFKSSE